MSRPFDTTRRQEYLQKERQMTPTGRDTSPPVYSQEQLVPEGEWCIIQPAMSEVTMPKDNFSKTTHIELHITYNNCYALQSFDKAMLVISKFFLVDVNFSDMAPPFAKRCATESNKTQHFE